jgi:hypothetical protein
MVMIVPPFVSINEIVVKNDHPDIAACRQKYDVIVEAGSEILDSTTSFSERWGYTLRIVYSPIFEGQILESDNIFMCWKKPGEPTHFVVSALSEEATFRKNMGQ